MDNEKIKDIYLPLGLIGLGIILMLVHVFFTGDISYGLLQGLLIVVVKTATFAIALMLGMQLCSFFGQPFTPAFCSWLQLLSIAMLASSLPGIVGIIAFLGLVGYFFYEDPINALYALFLLYAVNAVVVFLLMPYLTNLLS